MRLHASPLLTDLYQLTMLQGYFEGGMAGEAVFEFFVRRLPPERNFLVAAGLEQVLSFLEALHFTDEELQWLGESGRFSGAFIDHLRGFRFTGDVDAVAEGTIVFAGEPLLRVTAPLPQAQLVESRLINLLHLQTLIASKAARCYLAAPTGSLLVDFGMRRAHGAEAALYAARAGYLAGLSGTSTVLAGQAFGIPLYGTMAHSFIQAHDRESEAFERFARSQPGNVVLLLDTYDTERAAHKVAALTPKLAREGIDVIGVRLDSGDLAEHARKVRAILDRGGATQVAIFASGDLDEHRLERFRAEAVPINGFGIGTRLDTSADAPYLNCAYKLIEYGGQARRKRSEGKALLPGRKQLFRLYREGVMAGDTLTLEGETAEGAPQVRPVMRKGRRVEAAPTLEESRRLALSQLAALPEPLKALAPAGYPVHIAPPLRQLLQDVDRFLDRQAESP